MLDPHGPIAEGNRTILFNSLAIMLAIVIPTIFATLGFAWWFRAGNTRAKYLPDWEYSGQLELLVWSVPIMVVLFLGGVGWLGSHLLDPYKPIGSKVRPMVVQVVSFDWKWLFVYPEQNIASVNRLVIPAGTPIEFRLTSTTVMNSFFVPQLGSQIYAMAGMESKVHLMADRPGRFTGLSAQYSGRGFADMRFTAIAVPPGDFARWVGAVRGGGRQLDLATYHRLDRRGIVTQPVAFGAVLPGLFDRVVAQTMPPAQKPPVAPNVGEAEDRQGKTR